MPWHIEKRGDEFCVIKDDDGSTEKCHPTESEAASHMKALYANERSLPEGVPEVVVRALPKIEVEGSERDGSLATITGLMARWNEWALIDSEAEGRFMEQTQRGAFEAAIEGDRDRTRMLHDHGQHPQQGRDPLGPLDWIREDDEGARYRGKLLDTPFNRSILPGLKAGLFGSSFRGRLHQKIDPYPKRSAWNEDALPEAITEKVRPLLDVGPTPFPAYLGTVTTARSMTDEFYIAKFAEGEGLTKLAAWAKERSEPKIQMPTVSISEGNSTTTLDNTTVTTTTTTTTPPPAVPEPKVEVVKTAQRPDARPTEKRKEAAVAVDIDRFTSKETLTERSQEIATKLRTMAEQYSFGARSIPQEVRNEKQRLQEEHKAITDRLKDIAEWEADIDKLDGRSLEDPVPERPSERRPEVEIPKPEPDANIYDVEGIRKRSYSPEDFAQRVVSGAMRAIEVGAFAGAARREEAQAAAEKRLKETPEFAKPIVAEHYLRTGSGLYKRAMGKFCMYQNLSVLEPEEQRALISYQQRALSLTGASGGFAVPFELDPTILYTSSGTVSFVRQVSRVEQISVDEWRGISSAGITTAFAAEATETTDNAPTLAQPTVSTEKAQAFIPFSIEVGMDWDGLQTQMARGLNESKDELEAAKFISGTGTNEPFGVLTGTTNTVNAAAGQTFTLANLYSLQNALPARYQNNATFMGNLAVANRIRQFDTSGGAALWVQLGGGVPPQLLGWDFRIASDMADVATSVKFLLVGDFSRFLIVDRIGLTIDLIPHLFATNHRPTGQRGLYAYWRVGSKVLDANAFRALLGVA